ncbi:MAG TPA: NADPH:quinone oxidoreductase family protein [Candidatus Dormibacteraeota bacterium]|nr:NADPH:quinone oxidoreductase family protein [Candidatus Dormibacteraeota bacterium]
MKAWVVRQLGPPDSMVLEEVDEGPPPPDRVRIRIESAAVNFPDALLVAGTYQVKPELPFVVGLEVAGTVAAAPDGAQVQPGDRVLALLQAGGGLTGGGFGELVDVSPATVLPIPDQMTFEHASALMLTYQTGYFGLHRRAQLKAGEVLLVHAGAGGVGSAAIQLGKAAGARVVATAGSDVKVELCRQLGADLAVNYKEGDFVEAVKQFTVGAGADVIYDPVGGDVYDRSTKCIAFEGRLVVVGFSSGRIPTTAVNHALIKNYSIVGLHWGLYRQRAPELVAAATKELFRLYLEGKIRPHISDRRPLAEAPIALASVAEGRSTGKVVILPRS